MASAEFTLNGSAGPLDVAALATVTLQLTSVAGVNSVEWFIRGKARSAHTTPAFSLSGSPIGATAQITLGAQTGQGYLIECRINGGVDAGGNTVAAYSVKKTLFVLNSFGRRPLVRGEDLETDPTVGQYDRMNEAFGGLGDATSLRGVDLGTGMATPSAGDAIQFSAITGDWELATAAPNTVLTPSGFSTDPTVDTLTANEHVRAVADNIVADRGLQAFQYSDDVYPGLLQRCKARGNTGAPAIVQNADDIGGIEDYAYDGVAFHAVYGAYSYVADASPAASDVGVGFAEYFDAGGADGYELRRNFYPIGSDVFQFDIYKSNVAIIGDGTSTAFQNFRYSPDLNPCSFNGYKARGSFSVPATVAQWDQSFRANAYFWDGNSWHAGGAFYAYVADASPADGDIGTGWILEADEGNGGGSAVRFDLHPDGTSFLWDHKDTRHTGDGDRFQIETGFSYEGGTASTIHIDDFSTTDASNHDIATSSTVSGFRGELQYTWSLIGTTTTDNQTCSFVWRAKVQIESDGTLTLLRETMLEGADAADDTIGINGAQAVVLTSGGGGAWTIALRFQGKAATTIYWACKCDVEYHLRAV